MASEKRLISAKDVRARFNITDMTLWRWLINETLKFPKPIYILKRRFWDADEIEAFIARQAVTSKVA